MEKPTYHIIANYNSGMMKNWWKRTEILPYLKSVFKVSDIHGKDIGSAEDFRESVSEASENASHVVVIGGDGTLLDAINSPRDKDTALCYIQGGTGNAIAYDFGYKNPMHAARRIIEGEDRNIDLVRYNDTIDGLFAGIGLDGASIHEYEKFQKGEYGALWKKFPRSLIHPLAIGTALYKGYERSDMTFEIDGETIEIENTLSTMISKTQYLGKGIMGNPHANMEDGKIHIGVFDESIPQMFSGVVNAFIRKKHNIGKFYSGQRVIIKSSREIPFHIHGDYVSDRDTLTIDVLSQALKTRF